MEELVSLSFKENEKGKPQDQKKTVKHLVFSLSGERYAIPLAEVREAVGALDIRSIPGVPSYFKGIMNLRGKIISVIDLKQKLSLETKPEPKRPCIIISEVGDLILGGIVDDVLEVVGYFEEQIEKSIDVKDEGIRQFIKGTTKSEDKPLTLLLDIGKVLDIDELRNLREKLKNQMG